jgi:Methyltransferase FkbM domain
VIRAQEFPRLVAGCLEDERFTLIDLGCSGGIDPRWRIFEPSLRGLGVDASVSECQRLAEAEKTSGMEYLAAFAGIDANHPFMYRRDGRPEASRNPWERLSTARTMARRALAVRDMTDREKLDQTLWWLTQTADPMKSVSIPDLLEARQLTDVDFLKIDTDGNDFAILNSFDTAFDRYGILGALLEVNFCGSDNDTDRTFHNTDRFMKARGFELFDLTVRRYSAVALPARYELDLPAQTVSGRILQGDALYVRDWAAPDWSHMAAQASDKKILKLAAIFALMNLPDCAAEVLLEFRSRLGRHLDVGLALDLLAREVQDGTPSPLSYEAYIASFEADAPRFYPTRNSR